VSGDESDLRFGEAEDGSPDVVSGRYRTGRLENQRMMGDEDLCLMLAGKVNRA
jgi:hypothetical protein